ncbi:MAG: discoidin domain-containing protein, partial [Salinivirgaceae bacterium]
GNALEFGAAMTIDSTKDTYWTTDDNVTTASLTIDLGDTIIFNRFMAQEYIRLGQRVKAFTVEAFVDGVWKEITRGTTIGYKRILRFPSVNATKVRFNITGSKSCPVISNIGIYNAPLFLNAPTIIRNQAGIVTLTTNDIGPIFYYTLDGSEPTTESKMYTAPFIADGKVEVKAIAYDPASGKSGTVGHEKFDISKKKWKIVGTTDANATKILDGDPATAWHLRTGKKLPIDLVIDLGATYYLCGFKYLPDQSKWSSDVITNYQFYVSVDNVTWKLVNQGEFSNIQNNPVWQIKSFTPVNARYIKLIAVKTTWGDDVAGYSEVEVITDTYTGILEEGVTLDSEKDTIKISETKQLVATVIPSDASVKTVSWISSIPKVAKVSESGLVTAVSAGLANITATTANVGLKATCKITVLADTLTSVTQAKKLDDVAIFPNPLNGKQLTVDLGGLKGTTTIQFIEINGQTVLEQTVFDKQCTQLNVNLKPGIYMVRFSNNQNTLLKKLVIN